MKDILMFIMNENLSIIFPDVFAATMIIITILVNMSLQRGLFKIKTNKKLSTE